MATLPEDVSDGLKLAIDELESAVTDIESRLESARAERDEAKARQVELELENAGLRRELRLARDRQNAGAEILRSIADTSGDAERSLYQIAETSARLFGGTSATIHIAEGDGWAQTIRVGDSSRRIGAEVSEGQLRIGGHNLPGTVVAENRQVHIPDLDHVDPAIADWPGLPPARAAGTRSIAGAPLRLEGRAIGALIVYRDRLAPFTDEELALQQSFADQAAIAIENARLFNETHEALERQTATADILKVIASSPSDTTPVFEAIAASANRLLGGFSTAVFRFLDGSVHLAAFTPVSPAADAALKADFPRPVDEFEGFRLAQQGRPFPIPDTEAIPHAPIREIARLHGFRSMLFVPLMNGGVPIGIISITRLKPGAFSPNHIQLLQTFADQAVIAIENARLFNETQEALERQTATADILKVIASSPSDVQPVFDAIAASAKQLMGGFSAAVFRFVADVGYLSAFTPIDPAADEAWKATFPRRLSDFPPFDWVRGGEAAQVADTETEPAVRELGRLRGGYRSLLVAPLMSNGAPIGVVSVSRREPGTFAAHHVQLLQTFADQAVIAIENVRLFNEVKQRTEDLSESLQQQTATADVLKLISRSAFDLQTVLDTLIQSAAVLSEAEHGIIARQIGEDFRVAAGYGHSPERYERILAVPIKPGRGTFVGRAIADGRKVHVADVLEDPEFAGGLMQQAVGYRSILCIPLLREGIPIGVIALGRNSVRPFTDRQVELVSTFADQAVIAIENVRLFDEVQAKTRDLTESLQQQTATAEVLKVISRSAFDLQKVLDALLASACRLCEADIGTIRYLDGNTFRLAATFGCKPEWIEHFSSYSTTPDRTSIFGRTIVEGHTVHVPDVLADPDFKRPNAQKLMGFRAAIGVPLVRDGQTFGVVSLFRLAVGSFTEKQIELVSSFADQAVIAIENVRLFDELQARTRDLTEALTHQTGSANILRVIASSPTDVGPVLRAIVENACGLCEAHDAVALLRDGDDLRIGAHHGPIPIDIEKWPINRRWTAGRAFVDQKPVHVRDLLADESADFSDGRELSRRMGHRSILSVPLLRENESIGAIVLRRTEVHPFSDKQIKLLQTFADQAVIAIGNVRLFEEVQAKTRDLTEALTYQTGSANILKVIASSPTDVDPVLNAIVESACELCEAYDAVVLLKDGDDLRFSAHHGPIPINVERWPISREWTAGRAFVDQKPVHVRDIFSDEAAAFLSSRQLSHRSDSQGVHTVLSVPLLRENESTGAILLRRREVNPFSEKQIALLQTFADQAVIAIGNVQLFDEVQARTRDLSESLQQQTATADVLKVISRSTFDLQAVLSTLLESAARLCGADLANIWRPAEGAAFHMAASFGVAGKHHEWLENKKYLEGLGLAPGRGSIVGRTLLAVAAVQVQDVQADPDYELNEIVRIGDYRTMLGVPLLREGIPVGVFVLTRCRVEPFTDKQIELVSSFADQAVIAIENVRLFDEVEQRTRELSASLEELRTAQDRLIQTEKLASLGQLTAGIAHEIKNPLNFVNNFAALSAELTDELNEVLKPVRFEDSVRETVGELTGLLKDNLEKVVQHGKRADSIVKNMLLHSREGSGDHRPADINALLDESLNLAYHGARAEKPAFNVTLLRDFDPAAGTIEIFPQEITRVFLNLISNGFYAVTRRKTELGEADFDPLLSAATKGLGDTVEIRIRDNGTGIPPEVKEKMFNPFFTTKPAGEGTGLGLSMSHDIIVKQHGGSIDVATEPGQFTEFIIVLPRVSNTKDSNRGQP